MTMDKISDLVLDIAKAEILPRFKNLKPTEISLKSAGDRVSIADTEAEKALSKELRRLFPAAIIAGEETIAEKPALLQDIITAPQAFLIDPLDGTNNFIKGDENFALMLTQLCRGEAVAAWIYLPINDKIAVAEKDGGTYLNGQQITITTGAFDPGQLIGAAHLNRFPDPLKKLGRCNIKKFSENRPAFCAGYDYIALLEGCKNFSLYYRTLPWDHLPGGLIFTEAGGYMRTLFHGTVYGIHDHNEGLLSAANEADWQKIRHLVFPGCFDN